jgi:hypothetical protein
MALPLTQSIGISFSFFHFPMILRLYWGGQNSLFWYDNEEFGICIYIQKFEIIKIFVICYAIHLLAM